MEIHLHIIGSIFIFLAFVHAIFPRYFSWKTELATLSLINRQMMQIHTFFIALTVLLMGVLCLTTAADLCYTVLGKRVCLGLAIFWFIRLLVQFLGYSSELWKGKKLETSVHLFFSFLWAYCSIIFFVIFVRN